MLDLVEEALDKFAVAVKERAEGRGILAVGHWPDLGPRPLPGQTVSPFVAVVGPVAEEGMTVFRRATSALTHSRWYRRR